MPTDSTSRFKLRIESVPGQPGQKNLTFSPRLNDRIYTLKFKPDLSAAMWNPLGRSSFSDNIPLQQRTVTDQSATGARKFYHVELTKP